MADDDTRKREIDALGEFLANPNLSNAAFDRALAQRARLIEEEAEAMGIPLPHDELE